MENNFIWHVCQLPLYSTLASLTLHRIHPQIEIQHSSVSSRSKQDLEVSWPRRNPKPSRKRAGKARDDAEMRRTRSKMHPPDRREQESQTSGDHHRIRHGVHARVAVIRHAERVDLIREISKEEASPQAR